MRAGQIKSTGIPTTPGYEHSRPYHTRVHPPTHTHTLAQVVELSGNRSASLVAWMRELGFFPPLLFYLTECIY